MSDVKNSKNVDSSRVVYSSSGVYSSCDVYSSHDVYSSCVVYSSRDVSSSSVVYSSRDVDSSHVVDSSCDVYSSCDVDSSRVVYSSRYVNSSSDVIFCYDIKLKQYYAWNQQVTEKRFYEINAEWDKIKDDFKLELKDNEWEDEWKKFDKWDEVSKIPEFDKEITEKIIGFKIDLNKKRTVEDVLSGLSDEDKEIIKSNLK